MLNNPTKEYLSQLFDTGKESLYAETKLYILDNDGINDILDGTFGFLFLIVSSVCSPHQFLSNGSIEAMTAKTNHF